MDNYVYFPYFKWEGTPDQFLCKCCGKLVHSSKKIIDFLVAVRCLYKHPIIVTSHYRCKRHNEAVGGHPESKHLTGSAIDVLYSTQLLNLMNNINRDMKLKLKILPNLEKFYIHVQEET